MVNTETAQKIMWYAIGQDKRLKPSSDMEAKAMLMAWMDGMPEWVTFDLAREAMKRRALAGYQYPMTLGELVSGAKAVKDEAAREARRAAGVTKTVNDTAPQIESARAPMPTELKEKLARLRVV